MNQQVFIDENGLKHHGVLGMKWGRRRYQNDDGSPKPAGKGRYDGTKLTRKEKKVIKVKAKVAKKRAKVNAKFDKKIDNTNSKRKAVKLKKKKSIENALLDKKVGKAQNGTIGDKARGNVNKVKRLNPNKRVLRKANETSVKQKAKIAGLAGLTVASGVRTAVNFKKTGANSALSSAALTAALAAGTAKAATKVGYKKKKKRVR